MTSAFDEDTLRNWLVDYLVTNIGCSPDGIDVDAPLNDLAVGSSDAVVLTGELSELLGRTVSPVEFWQYPTINALAKFLTGGEVDMAAEVTPTHRLAEDAIAVVGLGCRFPGDIHGPDELWDFLSQGRSAVSQVPPTRWSWYDGDSAEGAAALAGTTRWGSYLSGIDEFDADYFEISPSEADKMDPQQRLLLEVTHEALEYAGIRPDALRHSQTGVFVGACLGEYGVMASKELSEVNAYSGTGGALSIIANRVSYYFDLRGPSVTVDTACSSSLVAIHLACQSLRTGDSDVALAGGVNVILSPAVTRSFDQAEAMSQSGRCHAFDSRADGFVRGEGCGVAVLKRLSDALRDGDRVLAVVRGSAVNQDGRSNGLMAPNPAAQMAVLRSAYAAAGIDPRDVDYVEAHGTGTLLGDPIEARALGTVLGRGRSADAPLLIGAIKSNLGHTEAAAGIAGFAKAVLALQHGQIPANLDYQSPNPHIPFDNLRLKVVDQPTEWTRTSHPRTAGVSSFGFGGTNAHVVLEQAPFGAAGGQDLNGASAGSAVTTLIVSGKSPQRISTTAGTLAEWMAGAGAQVPLYQVAHSLNHHRARHTKFATVCSRDRAGALAGLRALADGRTALGVVTPHQGGCRPGTVFVYSGQGSQWTGMGRRLLADEPAFAAAIAELEPVFVDQVGFSLQQIIAGAETVTGIDRIQPVLVGMQLALTELWRSYGVHPDAVIGHSMGEVAASVVAGALSVADGLKVIATRSKLMSRLSGQGAMALIELGPDAATALIADYPDVTLAVYASPRQTVIAGHPDQVDAVIAAVSARDRLARRVEVDVASHHPTIDPILPELREALQDLRPTSPNIPILITTREHDGPEPVFDADYWVDNLRNPVRFEQAVSAAGAELGTFIEVSPHPLLTYGISDTLGTLHHHSVPTLVRETADKSDGTADETLSFHTHLNSTYTTKPPVTDHAAEPHPVLPTTPWHHTRHWVAAAKTDRRGPAAPRPGTLLGDLTSVATSPPTHLWQARLVPEAKPYPGFHRIQGVEVVPMSVLLRTLTVAAAEAGAAALSDMRFDRPIVLDQARVIQVVASDNTVTMASAPSADAPANRWVRHATARIAAVQTTGSAQSVDVTGATDYGRSTVEQLQAKWGIEGQPFPWTTQSCRATSDGVLADVVWQDASEVALLDAAVQIARLADINDTRLLVPAAVEFLSARSELADLSGTVAVHRKPNGGDDLLLDVTVTMPDGSIAVDIRGLRYVDVQAGPSESAPTDPRTVAHTLAWQPWDTERHSAPGTTLAVIGSGVLAAALRSGLEAAGYTAADEATAACVLYVPDTESAATSDGDDLTTAARLSGEVAALVGRLAARENRGDPRLWIVTEGVRDADSQHALRQSCLWGIAGVIGAEHPHLWGGLMDLPSAGVPAAAVSALTGILPAATKSILSLRDGQLFAPSLVPLSGEPVREALRCRPDAAYLVTGGLGALGLLTAAWLADRGARRIVLAGRTALPPRRRWDDDDLDEDTRRKVAALRALEVRGVAVEVASLDVGSREALQALLDRRDDQGAPPIRGVVHGAGLTDSQLLTDIDDERLRRNLWPKVAGAQALHEVFPVDTIDFLYLTASAGTVFGVPGQGAYAAGNAYLDGLARTRHRQGGVTTSLDWVAWRGLGFGADAQVVIDELARHGSRPVDPAEAFAAWEYASRFGVAHVVMAPTISTDDGSEQVRGPERAWSQMLPEEVIAALETGLRAILATQLRIGEEEVDSDRPLAEMGLNSVMAMSIRREVETLAGIELSATMLWNYPTIGALAAHLAEKVAPTPTTDAEGNADDDTGADAGDSLLDSLFDSVESETNT
ncbi:type I polyketide synthase [Mycolicibacterium psychrotolerans]|uniref:Phthiocerol synthesis polyketide synthase type I PpsA n=1 Tax=Mycolicibacterium psychrotolerans TaxID=216929 RepID=A0A7I7MEH3_9MYCO|nr:type I polyketide synthase [Mycolicibacterium psychrotolerans]BBX70200.1 phthiocerol synthesis polyketide synthase type I PpsA [Mycolicibacterium psychrotolerans]